MAAIVRVVLVLLICWIRQCDAQDGPPSRISVSPTVIRLTPNTTDSGTKVTVTCEPPVSGVSTLLTLSISRWGFTSDNSSAVVLLSAVPGENNGNAKLLSNANLRGAEASGSVVGRSVTLTMNQAGCGDEAIYGCTALYLDTQTKPLTSRNQAELKVEVSPGQLEMTASPPDVTLWAVNQILTLTCTGPVGSVNTTGGTNDPVVTWVWQYRRLGMGWSTYDGPQSDITTGGFTSKACLKEQTSSLRRRVALNDTGREYQCFVRRNGQGYERFAASHYVGTVTPDGTSPDNSQPSASSTADAGAIAGGVIGALILIAIIVIIVYFMVIRPRRQKQEEEYVDDVLEKGGDVDAVPPPYTADSAVVYSQPTRRSNKDKSEGMANKGLDEKEEKKEAPPGGGDSKLPPDNDDRRHGRRNKDKKQPSAPDTEETHDYDSLRNKPPHRSRDRDQPRAHYHDDEEKERPSRRHDNRHGNDDDYDHRRARRPYDNDDDDRRGRRHRNADDYGENPTARYGEDQGRKGRRNHGYEHDNRPGRHHSSWEDGGGDDSNVNSSQYSGGDGDPSIGTAI